MNRQVPLTEMTESTDLQDLDGQPLLARLPGRADLPDGSAVHFAYDQANLHCFDAGTGRRLA